MDQPSIKLKLADTDPLIETVVPPQAPPETSPRPDTGVAQIGKMFARLDQKLTKKIDDSGRAERERIRDEIAALSRAVNDLEGVLRIEQPRELKGAVDECFDDWRKRRSLAALISASLVAFLIGVIAGTAFDSDTIATAGNYLASLYP